MLSEKAECRIVPKVRCKVGQNSCPYAQKKRLEENIPNFTYYLSPDSRIIGNLNFLMGATL